MKTNCLWALLIVLVSGWLVFALPQAHANVYASNIRLNTGTNNVAVQAGTPVNINYILNEAPTAGVLCEILSDTNVVRSFAFTNGGPGAMRGTNTVIWDGKMADGTNAPEGLYRARITAAANGFDVWTQISDDANPGNYSRQPRGIAVNKNTNSLFYGRIFVGNAYANGGSQPGDLVGVMKLNADGSFAEDGAFSTGGYNWPGFYYSPWKIEVSDDDKVYVNDWSGNGIVLAFDQVLSTNSYSYVLRPDNWPANGQANLSGPFITGAGTNTQIWMADINYQSPPGEGILRWTVTADGTLATNDFGTTIVQPRFPSDLDIYPYDLSLDRSGNIYTIQYRQVNDSAPRILRFPKYDESGTPELHADWKVGAGDDTLLGAYGISVDPTATHVAVAIRGLNTSPGAFSNGGLVILDANSGVLITNISVASYHDHTDVAWDNVGNVYDLDNYDNRWRVYSPPGTNQATTVSVQLIQVLDQITPPLLTPVIWSSNQFQFTLSGQSNVTYVVQSSTNMSDWTSVLTNYSSTSEIRSFDLPASDEQTFYRALVQP